MKFNAVPAVPKTKIIVSKSSIKALADFWVWVISTPWASSVVQLGEDRFGAILPRVRSRFCGRARELEEYGLKPWNVTQRIRRINTKLDSLIGQKVAEKGA